MLREARDVLEHLIADNRIAGIEELDAALRTAGFDVLPPMQPENGELSPADVQRLLDADWEGPERAVRLHAIPSLDDLASSRTLHNARLLLEMLGAEGEVKATPRATCRAPSWLDSGRG